MSNFPEGFNILDDALKIARETADAELREYNVMLPRSEICSLEGDIRKVLGIYHPPDKEETAAAVGKQDREEELSEEEQAIIVTARLREPLIIIPYTGAVSIENENSSDPVFVKLRPSDMDYINTFLLDAISDTRTDWASWFAEHVEESPEKIEREKQLWRNSSFEENVELQKKMRIWNTAFIKAGARPRPLFVEHFGGNLPSPDSS